MDIGREVQIDQFAKRFIMLTVKNGRFLADR